MIEELKRQGYEDGEFLYFATPYSKYPDGVEAAFKEAAFQAGRLVDKGVKLFCPISHGHPMSTYAGVDLARYDIWLPLDEIFMDKCDAICVCKMQGWDTSYGVKFEIDFFKKVGKPIYYLEPVEKEQG